MIDTNYVRNVAKESESILPDRHLVIVLCDEIDHLTAENEALREEVLKDLLKALGKNDPGEVAEGLRLMLVKNAQTIVCSYCGLAIDNSDAEKASEQMMKHIIECDKNPLVKILNSLDAENARYREALKEYANSAHWMKENEGHHTNWIWYLEDDPTYLARRALEVEG